MEVPFLLERTPCAPDLVPQTNDAKTIVHFHQSSLICLTWNNGHQKTVTEKSVASAKAPDKKKHNIIFSSRPSQLHFKLVQKRKQNVKHPRLNLVFGRISGKNQQ